MQKVIFIYLLTALGFSLETEGQHPGLDSLYAVWQDQTQPDSSRVEAYNQYIWNGYLFSNPDSAVVLAEALHSYAKARNHPMAAAHGFNLQGISNAIQGNYPKALEYFEKSLELREELGDKLGIAFTQNNIGNIYAGQGNYFRALEYYEKALVIQEELEDKHGIANCLGNIGNIYKTQGNYPRALEYHEKALAIEKEIEDKWSVANSLNNIGIIYKYQGNYSRALEYYEKSLALNEEFGDKQIMANNLSNVGNIFLIQGNYSVALEYYEKGMTLFKELGDKHGIANNLSNIGSAYQKQGKNTHALEYCQKGLVLAEEIGALEWQKEACQCLYNTYKATGEGNEALVFLEKLRVVEDSLHNQETTKKLEQMEFAKVMLQDSVAKAEEARLVQEAHQAEVRQKNQARNALLGSTLLFTLLAGGMYSRWRYVRKSRDIISKEKDRSENLLLNILPAEIAQELKEKGHAQARDFEMVSILFTDFKSFTETSARLSAAELVNEINACFEAFDGIIEKYGVEKIKTIGDAYMAAGGLPIPTDGSVKNTVLVALEMQDFIQKRKTENKTAGKPAFEMRVGIHTGPVVAGIVGVKKFQYDVWGDTVNTASRMESNGDVGKVNISQSTYEQIKDDPEFQFEPRGKVEAKGKGEMEMYFISRQHSQMPRT